MPYQLIIILLLAYIISILFGYVIAFSQAIQVIGQSISSTDFTAEFRNAITPPWFTKLATFTYLLTSGGAIFCLFQFGSLAIVGFFIAFYLNQAIIIPKFDSNHFRNLIIHSMNNRYADYAKEGDHPKASVIGDLLEKLGINVNESYIEKS